MNKLTLSSIALLALCSAASADEPRTSDVQRECNKVFEEARNLPAPTPSSIYTYGSRVFEQGSRCLEAGIKHATGGGAQRGD